MVQVSYGGRTFDLTEDEYNEAQGMLGSYLRKGKLPSYYGRSKIVQDYAGRLIAEAGKRGYAVQQGYIQQQKYLQTKQTGGEYLVPIGGGQYAGMSIQGNKLPTGAIPMTSQARNILFKKGVVSQGQLDALKYFTKHIQPSPPFSQLQQSRLPQQKLPSISQRALQSRQQQLLIRFQQAKVYVPRIQKIFKESFVGKGYDVISGGKLTKKEFAGRTEKINEQIEKFNQKYGGKELSEKEYNEALKEQQRLESLGRYLEQEKTTFSKSLVNKIGNYVWGYGALTGGRDIEELTPSELQKTKKDLSRINEQLKKASGLNRKRLQKLKSSLENYEDYLESGGTIKIKADTPPSLTPAMGLPRNIKVKFLGTQKQKGNKIITDIVFQQTGKFGKIKRIGVARGVTIVKGKTGTTLTLGRSGIRLNKKIPIVRKLFLKKQTFAGMEKSIVSPKKFILRTKVKIPRGGVAIVKKNLQGLKQLGIGRVVTAKGKKILISGVKFPSGKFITKRVPRISSNDFASLSAIFSKKDLSLIIGKAITKNKDKIKFIGMIKNVGGTRRIRLSGVQKYEFQQALKNVISVASASLSKTKSIGGLSETGRIIASYQNIAESIGKKGNIGMVKLKSVKKAVIKPSVIQKSVQKAPIGKISYTSRGQPYMITKQGARFIQKRKEIAGQSVSSLSRQAQRTRQNLRELQKQIQRTTQKTTQKTLQSQRYKLGLKLRQVQEQIAKMKKISLTLPYTPLKLKPLKAFKIKFKTGKMIKKQKATPVFNVYGKSGKKFIKLNTKPLARNDALSKGTFAIDNTTSKSFKIISAGRKKKVGGLRKAEENYFQRAGYKLREYKIRGGRAFKIAPKYIERTRYGIDTRGEKRGLSIARYLKEQRTGVIHHKRKISPVQRRIMLKSLAKARKVLARRKR